MAAGHRIYSIDWKAFTDLTSNSKSKRPEALADALSNPQTRENLELPATLPKECGKLTSLVRKLFLKPEWFADQSVGDVKLRNQLLFGLFFEEELKPIGMSATPTWRKFYETCSFDLAHVLAGRMALDLERMKRGKGVYYKILQNAEHDGNEFWWFGNRPYRHGGWQASSEEWMEYENEYDSAVHSIHSPHQVDLLSRELASLSKSCQQIECEELHGILADYKHCIEGVKRKKAGMFVENDT